MAQGQHFETEADRCHCISLVGAGLQLVRFATRNHSQLTQHNSARLHRARQCTAAHADNPTGQNINVTFNPSAVGGDSSAGLVAHEGSHVEAGSDWVRSGFSPAMNPTEHQFEMNAYHVQFNVTNALLGQKFLYNPTYSGSIGNVSWNKGDTFKMIEPSISALATAEIKQRGQNNSDPAFIKGAVLPQ